MSNFILNSCFKTKLSVCFFQNTFLRNTFSHTKRISLKNATKKPPKHRTNPLLTENDNDMGNPFSDTQRIPLKNATKRHVKHRRNPLLSENVIKLAPKTGEKPKQKFDYFLVLDFEATCDSPGNLDPQEIIEFPVLKINADSLKIESTFHSYVKPVIYPELTDFCTGLTGIIQSMVDSQPTFKEVFQNFMVWLEKENILKEDVKFAFVTCGDPDLDYLLPVQCQVSEITMPEFMKQWINIKRSFCEISPYTWPDNLSTMLKYCELPAEGELHSGLDDAKNVARVLADLAERGLVFDYNSFKKS